MSPTPPEEGKRTEYQQQDPKDIAQNAYSRLKYALTIINDLDPSETEDLIYQKNSSLLDRPMPNFTSIADHEISIREYLLRSAEELLENFNSLSPGDNSGLSEHEMKDMADVLLLQGADVLVRYSTCSKLLEKIDLPNRNKTMLAYSEMSSELENLESALRRTANYNSDTYSLNNIRSLDESDNRGNPDNTITNRFLTYRESISDGIIDTSRCIKKLNETEPSPSEAEYNIRVYAWFLTAIGAHLLNERPAPKKLTRNQ